MIITLPMLLGVLLALQVPSGASVPPVEPAEEALVDRFMAAIPPERNSAREEFEAQVLAAFEAANPGREAEVRRLIEAEAACVAPLEAELSRATLREVARGLGDDTLARLIAFYESADFDRMEALGRRAEGGAALSEGERADLSAIMIRYPLEAFNQAMLAHSADLIGGHPLFEKMTICHTRRVRAMEEAGLRFSADTP